MTIYNLGNVKGDKGDRGECAPGPTGPAGVGIKSIEQINPARFKFCLTDGSEYIMVYGSQPATLSLVSDKDILVPDEVANITATVLDENDNPLSGQTVTFEVRKQSDDSLIETLTDVTDSTGVATVSYLGQGTGDIYIKADCMLLTQTYNIEDCIFYVNSVSTTTSYNIDLPSSFKVSAIINPASRSSATANVNMGTDNNNKMFIGQTASDGKVNLLKRLNGSYVNNYFNSLSTLNADNYIECEYSDGVYTCRFNNETVTDNTGNITPSKLLTIETNSNISIKEIKVKPL